VQQQKKQDEQQKDEAHQGYCALLAPHMGIVAV
jgi:hypothetical protein